MEDINKSRSDKMKENFKNGIIKGWCINNDKNRRSFPEKFFIEVFKNNGLYEKHRIEEKFSYGKYFIDFLFVDIKLIFEVDGEQHFRDEKSIKHDEERDKYFLSDGFKIYRARWKDVCNNSKPEIEEFLNFLENIENENIRRYSVDECKYVRKKRKYKGRVKDKKCPSCDTLIFKKSLRCRECYLKLNKSGDKYREGKNICVKCGCNIHGQFFCKSCYDFRQRKIDRPSVETLLMEVDILGFSKTGKKYGVSDNCIRKWIKIK